MSIERMDGWMDGVEIIILLRAKSQAIISLNLNDFSRKVC
jgi:hypothetical protein